MSVCMCPPHPCIPTTPPAAMERYYSTLMNLPSELLISNPQVRLEDLKQCRWLARDTFLQMSKEPFAAANGIGQDHLQNFLNLQDAIVAKLLIQKLDNHQLSPTEKLKICGLLQLIFTESSKLIEFLFSAPMKNSILKLLIENCPSLFKLISLFKDFRYNFESYKQDFDNKFYYWNTIVVLTRKYPTQSTLDLSKEVIQEIQIQIKLETDNQPYHIKVAKALIEDIEEIFPFLRETETRKVPKRTKLS